MITFLVGQAAYADLKKAANVDNWQRIDSGDSAWQAQVMAVGNDSLFENQPQFFLLDGLLSDDQTLAWLTDNIAGLVGGHNHLFFYEPQLNDVLQTLATNHKCTVIDLPKPAKQPFKRDTTVFAWTDSIGAGNKKQAWLLWQSLAETKAGEEVHGALWWQIKTWWLVAQSDSNPGLNDYVYKKASQVVQARGANTIAAWANQVIMMPHIAHKSGVDLKVIIEEWVLGVV